MSGSLSSAEQVRHKAYRRAYEADLWNGAGPKIPAAQLSAAGHGELWAWFRRAWSLRDLGETVRIGEALQVMGVLGLTDLTRLRSALVSLGRIDEAAAMNPAGAGDPQDVLALAAAGRTREARDQLAHIDVALDPPTATLLRRVLDQVCGPETVWDAESGPIAAALELSCGDLAAGLAAEALGRCALSAEHFAPAVELLHGSFRLATPAAASRLLDALEPLFAPADRPAWTAVRRVVAGDADDGPIMTVAASEHDRFAMAYLLTAACAAAGRPDAAVRRLCSFWHLDLASSEYSVELARLVGLAERPMLHAAAPAGRRLTFDVFPFNGEFVLLDLKLAAMAEWVDGFVLVEAPWTFTNNPKPLYFQDNKARYARYADKIIHVIADAPPPFMAAAWAREYHQRDQGVRGLSGVCSPNDLVLISDVDEIVDPLALQDFCEPFATLEMRAFHYFFNYERVGNARPERKVGLVEARMLEAAGLSALRVGMWAYSKRRVPDAGWHFSSMLTPEDIQLKVQSYSHEEHQPGTAAFYKHLTDHIRAGYRQPGFARVPIDASFPRVLQERPEPFADFILPEPAS